MGEVVTTSESAVTYTTTATLAELCETRERLAADPELRHKVEAEQRAKLEPGWSFWIDDCGIGHMATPIHVSRMMGGATSGSEATP